MGGGEATFARFDAADRYLFSVPMWNAGVPDVLKQFIDVVSQPGMVFGFDPVTGYQGLLTGKKAPVIYAGAVWGADRGPGFGSDFQKPFFEDWLRWEGTLRRARGRGVVLTLDPSAVSSGALEKQWISAAVRR